MLKFVHTADLHLDSPFKGLKSMVPEVAGVLQEATFGAFDSVIKLCLDEEVDFLVVAGDVYDGADRSLRAQLRFRDGLRRLAQEGIPAFVAHGNHDPLDGWVAGLDWPEGVTAFPGDRVETVPVVKNGRQVAEISGISYPKREMRKNLLPEFPQESKTAFSLGVLHCNLGSDTGHEEYAPCTLADLRDSGFDYWALGHVHTRAVHRLEHGALAVYPGNPQGLHPGETGERGAVLVSVDEAGRPETRFVATDLVRWESLSVDISTLESIDGLIEALEEAAGGAADEAAGRSLCLRVVLEGRGALSEVLRRTGELTGLEEDLRGRWLAARPFVWLDRLIDRTRGPIDLESRRRSGDFVAGLLEQFDSLSDHLPQKEAEIREMLEPVYEKKLVRKYIQPPDEEKLKELLDRARELCLDYLVAEEE